MGLFHWKHHFIQLHKLSRPNYLDKVGNKMNRLSKVGFSRLVKVSDFIRKYFLISATPSSSPDETLRQRFYINTIRRSPGDLIHSKTIFNESYLTPAYQPLQEYHIVTVSSSIVRMGANMVFTSPSALL